MRRNLGKRALAEAWSFETSAAWQPGEESVAEVLYRHWTALVAEGAADPTIYVDHREAPELDLDDDDELEAALRHVYGPAAAWLDLPRIMAEIRDPQTDAKEARRFWLNQPSVAADAWLEPEQVERAAGAPGRRRAERGRGRDHARVRRLALRRRYRARRLHARRRAASS